MTGLLSRAARIAAVGFWFATPANAQEVPASSSQAPIGPIEQAGRLPGERLQIDAGTGDGSASISFSLLSRGTQSRPNERGVVRYRTDTINLALSTPWNGEDDAQPATLDGLANGTKLSLRLGRHVGFLTANRTQEMRDIEAGAREACRAEAQQTYRNQLSAAESALPDPADPGALERRLQLLAVEREQSLDACSFPPGGWGNLINQHLEDRVSDYIAILRPHGSHEYGLEASIGRNGFEFIDPATLADLEDTKVQWAARAYFTYYPVNSPTAFTVSAGYERAYEAADEAVFCPPNPTNVVVRCTTAAGGPPELNENFLLSAGLRHRFAGGPLANFAVAPVVTYDVIDDALGVDVPIYFIPNSDGGLTGGVRFGYRSDREDELSVGVFIGAAFNILN